MGRLQKSLARVRRSVVSIQLVSPASGENTAYVYRLGGCGRTVSIQLVFPTSGESSMIHPRQRKVCRTHLRGLGIDSRGSAPSPGHDRHRGNFCGSTPRRNLGFASINLLTSFLPSLEAEPGKLALTCGIGTWSANESLQT